jgi:hypothetical protein
MPEYNEWSSHRQAKAKPPKPVAPATDAQKRTLDQILLDENRLAPQYKSNSTRLPDPQKSQEIDDEIEDKEQTIQKLEDENKGFCDNIPPQNQEEGECAQFYHNKRKIEQLRSEIGELTGYASEGHYDGYASAAQSDVQESDVDDCMDPFPDCNYQKWADDVVKESDVKKSSNPFCGSHDQECADDPVENPLSDHNDQEQKQPPFQNFFDYVKERGSSTSDPDSVEKSDAQDIL